MVFLKDSGKGQKGPKKGKKGQKRVKKDEFSWGFVEQKGGRVRGGSNPPTFSRSEKVRSAPTRINTKTAIFLTKKGQNSGIFRDFYVLRFQEKKGKKGQKMTIFIDF